ncbi:MAG: long-chain fatty acid--CoA ligase [Paludibacter sp.]|jgi:long-chain acyl-CoA synthetase|nr:long-chain fatty acid--CoA ligase [Paludibacter sp.]
MEVTRLFDLPANYLEQKPEQEIAFASKHRGKWRTYSIKEFVELTDNLSYALLAIGIKPGDNVGIVSGNRPEWNALDYAIMQIAAVSVPIYPTISQEDYRYILNHAEMKIIFMEGRELRNKIEPILPELDKLKEVITFDNIDEKYRYLDLLVELGKNNVQKEKLAELKQSVKPYDLATIIYTSGTTGNPKGVMLSHNNIIQNFYQLRHIPSEGSDRALSFLPLCHAYERMLVYLYQYLLFSVYYAENLGTIAENIKEVAPTMMTCVPRVLEKMYDKFYLSGKKLPFIQRTIYYWAFELAKKYKVENRSCWYNVRHRFADKMIYSKWRAAVGGNFDIVVSGGSAIQKHMAAFFSAIGMPVFEGYGLSESSPVIAVMNRGKGGRQFGTVGMKMPETELRIGADNEIQCRGHNVMLGYYKAPEATAQVIDDEGWLHTGDTGILDENGVLRITGRLKSLFKTSLGKYVNPEIIEAKFCESPFIENMLVVGENQKFAAALIQPDFAYLKTWAAMHDVQFTTNAELLESKVITVRFRQEVEKYNQEFGDYEQVKKYKLVAEEWSQPGGQLSPTLKLKRKVVMAQYAKDIDKLFV